ncbi:MULTISPECIES: hypothetical protein [Brevibacterium]|uniref:hypothetical protein n=1 Tax=Brevibacterium TaxID=1696 RepID=UPI000DEBA749|nr:MULTISPECIES: hypothetical protein [Brevibacterium]
MSTRADLRDFIDLAPRLARTRGEIDHWVPLFASDIAQWHTGSGWFAEEVELWLLDDESGVSAARMICHRSPALAEKLAETGGGPAAPRPTLFFGALEAADPSALDELITLIRSRAAAHGCTRMFGPVSPLPNVTGGLLTDGADEPGFFDTVWNPEFLAEGFLRAGFAPWGRAQTWEVAVGDIPAPRATAPSPHEWADRGLRRRRVSRAGLRAFARRLLPTLNAAFARLPYYTEITPAQLRAQMAGLAALMDPALIVDVVGCEDPDDAPPRCFALVIPDPLPVLRAHDGRLGPAAIVDLLRSRRRLTDAVLIIQGTAPEHQGRGILSLVMRELNAELVAGGYRRLRVTFIAEDNPASAAVFANSGGRPLHDLAFIEAAVTPRTARGGVGAEAIAELFTHAARSPSAHNTQPWVPRLLGTAGDPTTAEVVVTVDPARCLPAGDPEHLDLHLSMGCWVESLAISAAEAGIGVVPVSVTGSGPGLEIRLHVVSDGAARAELSVSPEAGADALWPRFGTADLHHRQVDRGPLARDEPAFARALEEMGPGLTAAGLRLATIPDAGWRSLLAQASLSMIATPRIFAEALDWCRFDKRDPRYHEDGLTAECLRLPPILAVPGSRLNSSALRPWIARIAATAALPLDVGHRVLAKRFPPPAPASDSARPHHVVLTADAGAGDSARDEIAIGRCLLRTWLLFDRHGLRVDVHSELKDIPETNQGLRDLAGPGRPLAAFSVGRSTTPVPRSHRKPP